MSFVKLSYDFHIVEYLPQHTISSVLKCVCVLSVIVYQLTRKNEVLQTDGDDGGGIQSDGKTEVQYCLMKESEVVMKETEVESQLKKKKKLKLKLIVKNFINFVQPKCL